MEKTVKEIITFVNVGTNVFNQLNQQKEEKKIDKISEKLKNNLKKSLENIKEKLELYNEKLEDLKLDFCSVDNDNNIVYDEKQNFKYTRENYKKLNKEIKKLQQEKINITLIESPVPKDFPIAIKEIFKGFLFKEDE